MAKDTNFSVTYKGPWKGIDVSMPENAIDRASTPFSQNFIMKNGELRSRPRQSQLIPALPDGTTPNAIHTFTDSNNVTHTVAISSSGLWQLNRNWPIAIATRQIQNCWSKVGTFPVQPGLNIPSAHEVFVNKFFWTTGGSFLWSWDGITSTGFLPQWQPSNHYYVGQQIQDSNGNWQVVTQSGISKVAPHPVWSNTVGTPTIDGTSGLQWGYNGIPLIGNGGIQSVAVVDVANKITAGAYFLGILASSLLLLNTIENGSNFAQRVRWSPSGIPNIWDPNVNIGAGFEDLLDTPDSITGCMFVGSTGLIARSNGTTEMSIGSSGINPFVFNHFWASEHGIGNIFPFSMDQYGPIGMFISQDDIYEYSLGGFKDVGGGARDAIFNDLANTNGNPAAAMVPVYQNNYVYLQYVLLIPLGNNMRSWRYSLKDKSWQSDLFSNKVFIATPDYVAIS
jgi:hypothetical protein